MSVLIVDADYKQSLSMARSLARKSIPVTLASHIPQTPALYSRFCTQKIALPDPLADKTCYVRALLEEVKNNHYDLLITLRDETTEYLSEHRHEFALHTAFALPPADIVRLCLNKHELTAVCEKHGIPVPRTHALGNSSEIAAALKNFSFPVVVKYPRGGGGSGNRYCNSADEVAAACSDLLKSNPDLPFMPMIQEHIRGRHLDYYALCDNGKVLASFQFAAIRTNPPTGGNGSKCISINIPELNAIGERLCSVLNYHGVANMDFMQDTVTGKISLLEVNPRFGGLTPLAILSGVDLPYLLWKTVVKHEVFDRPSYKTNIVFRSLFYDEVYYALSCYRKIPLLLLEFLDPRIKYDIHFTDLRPLKRQIRCAAKIIRDKMNA